MKIHVLAIPWCLKELLFLVNFGTEPRNDRFIMNTLEIKQSFIYLLWYHEKFNGIYVNRFKSLSCYMGACNGTAIGNSYS